MTQDQQERCITICFHVLHGYTFSCCIRCTARTNSAYYSILTLSTYTIHVCDYITPNYTSMVHKVCIYYGTVALFRDLIPITDSHSKTEWISRHDSRNNIRNNESRQSGTMKYDTFPRITLLDTVLLHSMHCKNEFRVFQYINFVHTY